MLNVYTGSESVGQRPNALLCVYIESASVAVLGGTVAISGFWGPFFDS